LRAKVADNFNQELIFSGTLWENITLGRNINPLRITEVSEIVGLTNFVQSLEKGYQTELLPEDKRVSGGIFRKIILARTILDFPSLLLLENFENLYSVGDNEKLIDYIMSSTDLWTLVLKTSDKDLIRRCDRLIIMDKGEIIFNDVPSNGLQKQEFQKYFH
jgi:ABC-type bacteriocin/lantibiotic exporter with double-glycine peptidase domain